MGTLETETWNIMVLLSHLPLLDLILTIPPTGEPNPTPFPTISIFNPNIRGGLPNLGTLKTVAPPHSPISLALNQLDDEHGDDF